MIHFLLSNHGHIYKNCLTVTLGYYSELIAIGISRGVAGME